MKVTNKSVWAVLNPKTGRVVWTKTSKRPAFFRTRELARDARNSGETGEFGQVVRFVPMFN